MISFAAAYLLRLGMWGLVIALLLGGPIWASWSLAARARDSMTPQDRHRSAVAHLAALLALPLAAIMAAHLELAGMGDVISRAPPTAASLPQLLGGEGNFPAEAVVAAWAIGALIASIRLGRDIGALAWLRTRPAPGAVEDEVARLAERIGYSGQVRVRTADVASPLVLGWRMPVMVLPFAFQSFSAAEREALVLHELAHVVRRDVAANLVQRLILVMLWFQPAARALHRRICREREICCDQVAVRHGGSAPALARALIRLAENGGRPAMAMAALPGGDLSGRVRQLLAKPEPGPPRRRRRRTRRTLLLGGAVLAFGPLGGAALKGADTRIADLYIASPIGPVVAVQARDPAGSFDVRVRQGRVIDARVEDQVLPAANIRQQGAEVTLLNLEGRRAVSFRVTPFGRINWRARAQRPNPA